MLNYAHDVLKRLQALLVISPVSIKTNKPLYLQCRTCALISVENEKSITLELIKVVSSQASRTCVVRTDATL